MKRLLHTALLAVLIPIAVVSVLYGVRAVLPDYTDEIHAYSKAEGQFLPVFEPQKELVLYPWKELTQTEPLEDSDAGWLFYEISSAFGWDFSFIEISKAELCYSADGMTGGIRNVTAYIGQLEEHPADAETEWFADVNTATLSAAFDSSKETFCWFFADFLPEDASDASIRAGYETLCAESQTLLATFAKQYETACLRIGATGGIDAVAGLLAADEIACELYGGRAYLRYASEAGTLILICDPISRIVLGFSLEIK
ncbi:MAG: hypothetical protein IJD82_10945 [Clostridia bacterium]|nr:hypothetical protein [Clostridia bacterium]